MAETDGPSKTAPPRPTISLPPRSSIDNFFGRGSDGSPGPMTLVSSFFSENDPDSDCRSFSQLLAGAMASPVAAAPGRNSVFSRDGSGGGDEGGFGFKQSRPMGLMIAQSPLFTVPPGLSPATLLDSPGFFSSGCQSPFGISHQQALAQVTAQAAQCQPHALIQPEYPSKSMTMAASSAHRTGLAATSLQQMQTLASDSKTTVMESAEVSHSDQRSQPASLTVDKPADDGYNWRKYGQKQVKGSEYPRSYYKCTYPNCPVKKKVERSLDGQVTEIIYKGQHNHQQPQPNRRAKDGGLVQSGSAELNGNLDLLMNSEKRSQDHNGNLSKLNENVATHSMSRKDQEFSQTTPEQLSGSSDGEEPGDGEMRADEGDDNEPDPKRRNIDGRVTESGPSHRTVTESRIIVQTTSEVDLLDDGYRWRKYGQKVVKGNPYPRSYYKCTSAGCGVRKHVERASTDPKAVITTYEGKHNHDVPAAKTSSHNTANSGTTNNSLQLKPHRTVSNNQARMDFRNNDGQPVELLMLKEEHDIT